MTTPITSFNRKECELIPGAKVAAYVELSLDPENPTGVILDSTWGESKVDLTTVVKAGETITRLYLAPETGAPQGICYEKEDGTTDYISGDELSRIVSLQLLKDVDQTTSPTDGIVYQFDENTSLFEPYDLKTFVNNTTLALGRLQTQITAINNKLTELEDALDALTETVNNHSSRLTTIEAKLTPPTNAPNNVSVAFGNVNAYGDITSTNRKDSGIYTHDPNVDKTNDLMFS